MENKEGFNYTYSAKEQAEIKNIRKKYEAPAEEEDKMAQLRRLDASVNSKAAAVSLAVGIISALIMGTGMSIIMTKFSDVLALYGAEKILIGMIFGVIGLIGVALAYPIYNRIVKKERARIAPEIIRLTDELMK